jgi:hypothetical protein
MAESILSIQQGAFGQIGLSKPFCPNGTLLMEIKASVPRRMRLKKKVTVLAHFLCTSSARQNELPCVASFFTLTIIYLYF